MCAGHCTQSQEYSTYSCGCFASALLHCSNLNLDCLVGLPCAVILHLQMYLVVHMGDCKFPSCSCPATCISGGVGNTWHNNFQWPVLSIHSTLCTWAHCVFYFKPWESNSFIHSFGVPWLWLLQIFAPQGAWMLEKGFRKCEAGTTHCWLPGSPVASISCIRTAMLCPSLNYPCTASCEICHSFHSVRNGDNSEPFVPVYMFLSIIVLCSNILRFGSSVVMKWVDL